MSFPLRMSDNKVMKMQSRIDELEKALLRINRAKKQLGRNTAEAKSRIQCNISRQLETLRNREVWLLNQLDTISGVKEEVLQQQSVRLNKTLGVLQSSVKYPDGSGDAAYNMQRMDLGDLQPEETPHVSFKSEPGVLREAIMNYGHIDANSVTGIQSPFMDPDHQAPSLPRHFEDYNDAEHHVLYKTVEELNRTKTVQSQPSVPPIGIKLSTRIEDWLMPTDKTTGQDTSCTITLPKLSNNLSDWLRSPVCLTKEPGTPIDDMSSDASIQTWLHKIKQSPMEEEDEDYEFIDHDSETRTTTSELEQFPDPDEEDTNIWLYKKGFNGDSSGQMISDLSDGWLLKSRSPSIQQDKAVDMSRYFTKITDDLDQWLVSGVIQKQGTEGKETTKPGKTSAPTTLALSQAFGSHVSRADNPWLLKTNVRSSSISPVSSCRSSLSSFPTQRKPNNKWLLNGGQTDHSEPTTNACPTMDLFKQNANTISWLKSGQHAVDKTENEKNPMANFHKLTADPSMWLKPSSQTLKHEMDVESPAKKLFDGRIDSWLQKSKFKAMEVGVALSCGNLSSREDTTHKWYSGSLSSFPQHDDDIDEIDL